MAGKLVSSIGGQGPGGGGFMDILLPFGLGLAAAAHPALARGAHAITQGMATAGRNKRLREAMELEQKREGRAATSFENEQAMFPFRLKEAERKSQYGGIVGTGGGGHGIIRYTDQGPVMERLPGGGEWVGSEPWRKAQEETQKIHTQGAVAQAEALMPIRAKMAKIESDLILDRQTKVANMKMPLTAPQAISVRRGLVNEMKAKAAAYRQQLQDSDIDERDYPMFMERFVRNMHENYKSDFDYVQRYLPDMQPYPLLKGGIPSTYSKAVVNGKTVWFNKDRPEDPPFIVDDQYTDTY